MKLYHVNSQRTIVHDLEIAADIRSRAHGLIGHKALGAGQGMMIRPCRWIHTFGMSFPIDVIYVGRDWRIVACTENLMPKRIDRPMLNAQLAIEMAAGAIRHLGLNVRDRLELRE